MKFIPTIIPDILLIEPKVFQDERGFSFESYQSRLFSEAGIRYTFVQDNHSGSQQGTLRGLHYQIKQAQGKLVRVVAGEVFDVAVDIRRKSKTLGQWVGNILSSQNKLQLWIPPGFAHGFYVISHWADIIYKVTDYYAPDWERTLLWNDPVIGINWHLLPDAPLIISPKDAKGKTLKETVVYEDM